MSFDHSPSRIKEITIEGEAVPVNEWNDNSHILINPEAHRADEPREYMNDKGETIKLNQYNDILDFLEEHSFC